MNLTIQSKELQKGLKTVSRAVGRHSIMPILGYILLEADTAGLQLRATNLEETTSCRLEAQVSEPGSLAVQAKPLLDLAKMLDAGSVTLARIPRGYSLAVKTDRGNTRIGGMDPDEFPPMPVSDGSAAVTVDAGVLREATGQVVIAAANDNTRPVLTGVLFRANGHTLTLAAADGFRLTVKTMCLAEATEGLDMIVPAKAVRDLGNLLEGTAPVRISQGQSVARFDLGDIVLSAQIITGSFPDYERLIPSGRVARITASTADLRQAVKVVGILSAGRDHPALFLAASDGRLVVLSEPTDLGHQGRAEIDVEGGPGRIALNVEYLHDALTVIRTSQVALDVNEGMLPMALRGIGDDSYVHVIMPMETGSWPLEPDGMRGAAVADAVGA